MAEEKKQEPKKSTLGDRMSDVSGMKIFRDGKWIPISEISKEEKPKKIV